METASGRLTVFFEGPFWAGLFERISAGELSVCKVTFGAEPSDREVLEFILRHSHTLRFSPAVTAKMKQTAVNPKRRQRMAARQLQKTGIGTRSQQALQLQREEMKLQRRQVSSKEREAEKQRHFELRQQKRKEKHRGH